MSRTPSIRIVLAASALLLAPAACSAGEPDWLDAYTACLMKHGIGRCIAYALRDGVPVLENDASTSRVLGALQAGYMLPLANPRSPNSGSEWIPVIADLPGKGMQAGWVHRSNVVFRDELRRVSRCWPAMSFRWKEPFNPWEAAGTEVSVEMSPTGDARRTLSSHPESPLAGYGVYFGRGVFVVVQDVTIPEDEGASAIEAVFVLDAAGRRVLFFDTGLFANSRNAPTVTSRFRSTDALRGCDSGPVVSPSRGIPDGKT